VFQAIDAPRAVNEEGMSNFVYGITEEMKQKRREQLLDVTKDQVREVAQRYIVDALSRGAERLVFLGEKRDFVDESWEVTNMDINGTP
jgi:Zn-dependent M16 (insulinase) family peptidase